MCIKLFHIHFYKMIIFSLMLIVLDLSFADNKAREKQVKNDREIIIISPETIQNMGVRTEKVKKQLFGKNVRSYGLVTENERNVYSISARVSGWIKTLKFKAIGDEIKKGDVLFTLFSPDLIAAQGDYLSSLASGISGRIQASAMRLYSLGVEQSVIHQIRPGRKRRTQFPFYAKHPGVLSALMVKEGSYVKPGMEIAKITDYSSVWIEASIAEKDIGFLNKESQAFISFPNLGVHLNARIDYIYPVLNSKTRTASIRLILENKEGIFKPGAYADILFETDLQERLSIPSEAILRSSGGDYAIIALGKGRFQPKKIHIGIRSQGRTEILHGLREGENIVVSGQFLIDSESSLRETFRKMGTSKAVGGKS